MPSEQYQRLKASSQNGPWGQANGAQPASVGPFPFPTTPVVQTGSGPLHGTAVTVLVAVEHFRTVVLSWQTHLNVEGLQGSPVWTADEEPPVSPKTVARTAASAGHDRSHLP